MAFKIYGLKSLSGNSDLIIIIILIMKNKTKYQLTLKTSCISKSKAFGKYSAVLELISKAISVLLLRWML